MYSSTHGVINYKFGGQYSLNNSQNCTPINTPPQYFLTIPYSPKEQTNQDKVIVAVASCRSVTGLTASCNTYVGETIFSHTPHPRLNMWIPPPSKINTLHSQRRIFHCMKNRLYPPSSQGLQYIQIKESIIHYNSGYSSCSSPFCYSPG